MFSSLGLCSATKVETGFLSTKKEFKFEQEVVAALKVLNLKSDLKDEGRSTGVTWQLEMQRQTSLDPQNPNLRF